MFGRSAMVLVTALLMFPQIVETIYSPALTDISRYFSISAAEAAQTLSVYFIGFAVGVLYWGRFSDRYGRRPALLAGLATYALGCVLALAARDFTLLLVARILSAFGAATGSVVSQTILRDRFNGRQLAALFSMMGLVLAVSPAAGVYLGGAIVAGWGMHGVLTALALLAAVLLLLCCWLLPEKRLQRRGPCALSQRQACLKRSCRSALSGRVRKQPTRRKPLAGSRSCICSMTARQHGSSLQALRQRATGKAASKIFY